MQYNERAETIYKVTAPTLDACRQKLYNKYQTNYEIINFKPVLKGGFLGLFQRQFVEAEYMLSQRQTLDKHVSQVKNTVPPNVSRMQESASEPSVKDLFLKNRDSILQSAGTSLTTNLQLGNLSKQLEKVNEKLDAMSHSSAQTEKHESIKKIEELLYQNEFTKSYIDKISEKLRSEFSLDELDDFDRVSTRVVDWIGKDIQIAEDEPVRPPRVIVIVGPTGVGKTTTVAKMAAEMYKVGKVSGDAAKQKKIRFISIDTIRVAAAEQLKHWGELMQMSVESCEDPEQLKELYESYNEDYDYLFIDTSGYSPNDLENIAKLHKFLDVKGMKANIFLAVTAGSKAKDLENIIRNYESFNFKSVIVTKCDETTCYGSLISVLSEKRKSISWVTNGQYVLNSLDRAHPIRFLKCLDGFKIDRQHLEDVFGPLPERKINP